MKDSVTYQAITQASREEGREEEALNLLLRVGERRFGVPNDSTKQAFETVPLSRLEHLVLRALEVEGWDELLAE